MLSQKDPNLSNSFCTPSDKPHTSLSSPRTLHKPTHSPKQSYTPCQATLVLLPSTKRPLYSSQAPSDPCTLPKPPLTLCNPLTFNKTGYSEISDVSTRTLPHPKPASAKYQIFQTLKRLQDQKVETGHFYIQVVDYLTEVTKALLHCTRPAFEHIDNHHHGFTQEQIYDLKLVNDGVDNIFNKINEMLRERDFAGLDDVLTMRDNLFIVIADAIKNQIKRLKEEQTSTKASMLYLNILNETKTMVLQSRNLIKSQAYFLSQMKSADNGAAENSGVTAQEAQN